MILAIIIVVCGVSSGRGPPRSAWSGSAASSTSWSPSTRSASPCRRSARTWRPTSPTRDRDARQALAADVHDPRAALKGGGDPHGWCATSAPALDYPCTRLDVKLLCGEGRPGDGQPDPGDAAAAAPHLVVVPDSQPKTKPKACNYGLQLAAGELTRHLRRRGPSRPRPAQEGGHRLPGARTWSASRPSSTTSTRTRTC